MQIQSDNLDAIESMTNSTLADSWPKLVYCARDVNEEKSLAENTAWIGFPVAK